MPKVDGTDFYMFRSYEPGRADYVTLIANYLPLQDAYGGPNYFTMDPTRCTRSTSTTTATRRKTSPSSSASQNTLATTPAWPSVGGTERRGAADQRRPDQRRRDTTRSLNVIESYTVELMRGDRRTARRSDVTNARRRRATFRQAGRLHRRQVDPRTTPPTPTTHIYDINIPGCATPGRVFVGQRKEGFAVNLGEIFDLVNIRPGRVDRAAGSRRRTRSPTRTSPRSRWRCRSPASPSGNEP